METFTNIYEFIEKKFPVEMEGRTRQKKSKTEEKIERASAEFNEKLKAIIEGKSADDAASTAPKPD